MLFIIVGVAGMIGSLLRYYLGIAIHGWWIYSFPMGTLITNSIGCFVLGWFTTRVSHFERIPVWFRIGFGTGLIGSFTTFSTFSVETVSLFREHLWLTAYLYLLLSILGGLLAAWGGLRFASMQLKRAARSVHSS